MFFARARARRAGDAPCTYRWIFEADARAEILSMARALQDFWGFFRLAAVRGEMAEGKYLYSRVGREVILL